MDHRCTVTNKGPSAQILEIFPKSVYKGNNAVCGSPARIFSGLAKSYWISPCIYIGCSLSPTPVYLPKSEQSASSTLLVHWNLLLFLTVQIASAGSSWTKITRGVWCTWKWTGMLISKSCSLCQLGFNYYFLNNIYSINELSDEFSHC